MCRSSPTSRLACSGSGPRPVTRAAGYSTRSLRATNWSARSLWQSTPMREFRVGLRSVPSLADHGFQDMVVLPGAFYVALARSVERELGRDAARVLHNVVFHHPLILSSDDTVIQVEVSEHDGRVDYAFADAAGKEAGPAATLTCDRQAAPSANATLTPPEGKAASLEAAELYRKLRENGNQYGPAFQRVTGVWRT